MGKEGRNKEEEVKQESGPFHGLYMCACQYHVRLSIRILLLEIEVNHSPSQIVIFDLTKMAAYGKMEGEREGGSEEEGRKEGREGGREEGREAGRASTRIIVHNTC